MERKNLFAVARHRFNYVSEEGPTTNIEFTVDGHCTREDMLEAFTHYLKAVGFFVDSNETLDFIKDDTQVVDEE